MNIKPLGERVVIKPQDDGTQQIDGIYIPDSAQEKPQKGEVVALGTADSFNVKVGDTVLMPKYGGTEVKLDGTEYQIMDQDSLLGIMTD